MHPQIDKARATTNVWVDRAASRASRLSKGTLSWTGLALAGLAFLAVNLFASNALRSWRADFTRDSLYTISEGTKRALAGIDEPIDLKVYFTKKLGEVAPQYQKSFERVRTLLEQYRSLSNGKLRVTYYDPEPFSDAQDRADAAGIRGIALNQDGDQGYFGLAGTNSTDNELSIPMFTQERERFIEYDVTKMIYALANPKKRVIGLISSIPLEGGMDPMQGMRGRPQPPQMILEQMKEVFEVKALDKDLTAIPKDVDVLMLVQPEGLAAGALYAVDQYALGDGKILVFVDPVAETQGRNMGGMMMPPSTPKFGDFDKILASWGVAFDSTKVAGDKTHARRVQFGGRGGAATVTQYVAWIGLDKRNLDARDVLSAGVEKINVASAGVLTKVEGATTTVAPILQTSEDAMQISAEKVSMMPDAPGLLRDFKPEKKKLMLAARISGDAKSAFPEAPIADVPPADPSKTPELAKTEPAKTGDAGKKDEPKKDVPKIAATPHKATGKVNIIVIADTDMLQDQFWVQVREMMGQQIAVPHAQNSAFVVGALENLSGSDALISLRGRGVSDRPFTYVDAIRTNAEQKFRTEELVLTNKVKEVTEQLSKLEKGADGESVLITDKDKATIEGFRGELLSTRKKLRDVKLAMRQDIDRLDGWLKFFNIAFVPLLIGAAGVWYARRRRNVA